MNLKFRILFIALTILSAISYGQNMSQKKIVLQKVFDNIVNAYGNSKASPLLQLVPKNKSEGNPAFYSSTPVPAIKIEEQAFDICMQFGSDSLNALSIIISHELAHYYNDHTWCSDFSYAIKNSQLGKTLRALSKTDRIKYETQADNYGFYYSCISGYSPFDIYDKLIDKIYTTYKLPNNIPGYPTKDERKMIAQKAQEKIRQLYPVFEAGVLLLYLNYLSESEACFEYLAKYFPSREIYNNLGTAKFLKGIALKPHDTINFIYPIDVDPLSRLYQTNTRGLNNSETLDYVSILKDAKKQFEKAIVLDPSYTSSYVNLACVNDVLGNYPMALGNLFELNQLDSSSINLKHIKAIIEFHMGNKIVAEKLFQSIASEDSIASFNYRILEITKSTNNNNIVLENFKDNWAEILNDKKPFPEDCNSMLYISPKTSETTISINNYLDIKSQTTGTDTKLEMLFLNRNIDATISQNNKTNFYIKKSLSIFKRLSYGCLIFENFSTKKIKYRIN